MKFIDLRSDTVTIPTEEMRQAMFSAEVGDDVYGDDPTVQKLEKLAASIIGKEAALFVPSGTFGNQLALFTHCARGTEVILGEDCHIFEHEVGAASIIAGVHTRTLQTTNGKMEIKRIQQSIRPDDLHFPETSLICLENAYSNGAVVDLEYMKEVFSIAKNANIPVHLDGARIFNAATYLKTDAKELSRYSDSVMFCLSKGLCAPVGSILAGSKEFIEKAKKKRKLLGGGWRQSGFLAAAGIIALEKMTKRLHEDHENALYLAERLSEIPTIKVDLSQININLVFFQMTNMKHSPEEIEQIFKENGIIIFAPEEDGMMRFATHYWITKNDIDKIIEVMKLL
ncbi:low-specificity L-threonine aldolase [Bacillus sp. AFS017336]|uniref:low-specificity L-threonine aldolase n=1 Tax=Bacillus sp. AFS017336 TaxID=2033489 RepID=UPI000BF1C8AF|nr:low-specificity L-threonine aldolase [Bacillus sp. AFS017336]PEL14396.1 low-specificity L-threonine aldolase [Bacillus sp. AFS017336]